MRVWLGRHRRLGLILFDSREARTIFIGQYRLRAQAVSVTVADCGAMEGLEGPPFFGLLGVVGFDGEGCGAGCLAIGVPILIQDSKSLMTPRPDSLPGGGICRSVNRYSVMALISRLLLRVSGNDGGAARRRRDGCLVLGIEEEAAADVFLTEAEWQE